MQESAKNPVKALEKTVVIMEVLGDGKFASISRIADETGLNRSVIHNHLSTLLEHGYVVKNEDEYRLSFRFLHIGGNLRTNTELYSAAKSQLDELADQTGELVTLAIEEQGLGVILYRSKGEKSVDIDTHLGSQVPLHSSGFGKAILAYMDREEVDAIVDHWGLEAKTPNTITDRETLYAELEEIAAQGYAVDDEENWRGLQCFAVPILDKDDTVVGSISISAPKTRIANKEIQKEYINQVRNAANIIELRITYSE